jgi:hypothetical protein
MRRFLLRIVIEESCEMPLDLPKQPHNLAPQEPFYQAITQQQQLTQLYFALNPGLPAERDLLRALRLVRFKVEAFLVSNDDSPNMISHLQTFWGWKLGL